MFTIADDKFLRDKDGKLATTFVDSFSTVELIFPQASIIAFRLWESTEFPNGALSADNNEVPIEKAHQFRISTTRARALATALIELADDLEGVGHPQQ